MTKTNTIIQIRNLGVAAGKKTILQGINLDIVPNEIFGLIGPSGSGKSTLLRCINRLTDLDRGLRVTGNIQLNEQSIRHTQPDDLRMKLGMLFQQPTVFPTSIIKNVLFGVRRHRVIPKAQWADLAERVLREVALWDEVKDRLRAPATKLSVGQQQRLCLARTLAVDPEVILMDEPTSALDPRSTRAIEEMIASLKATRTIILVTHHLDQARRLCDRIALVTAQETGIGRIACCGPTSQTLGQTGVPELDDFLHAGDESTLS